LATAIYPGSFDPITCGHIDIARRAARMFDRLIVAVYDTPSKNLFFTTAERIALAHRAFQGAENIEVGSYAGLTVDYARSVGASVMVRGLRALSDFEVEMQMSHFNRKMDPDLDVVCLLTSLEYGFLSASMVKEIIRLGGPSEGMVPDFVAAAIHDKVTQGAGDRTNDQARGQPNEG
jgi:pantetheine-phosphate adenylyltransferase